MTCGRRTAEHRSAGIRIVEAVLICIAALLLLELALDAWRSLRQVGHWWLLVPMGVLGLVSADFASGTLHWLCDRFFRADTPLLGRMLIRPFREHHVDPVDITRHDLLELHGNSCIPVIAVLGCASLLPGSSTDPVRLAFDLWLGFFLAASLATNQFHMWAHAPAVPAGVRWLQRHGLILSAERHQRHHRGDFDRSYCMTLGVLNPWLDRVDFFGKVERRIRALPSGRS
jgi:ubiquitin-conjugating enzyme E2 variant